MAENPPQAFKPYLRRYSLHHPYRAIACRVEFSPDGLLVAFGCDRIIYTFCLTPYSKPSFHKEFKGHTDRVTDLSFSSDSRFLATSSYDSTIRLWNVIRGSLVRTFTSHNDLVLCVKFNPESNMIASGSFDEVVRIWDVNSGECLKVLAAHSGIITTMDFSPDGSMIVAGSFGGLCRIWDTATGNSMITIKEPGIPPVGSVKFSSDGKSVLIGFMDSTLRIWSMDRGMLHTIYAGHVNTTCSILSTFLGPDERYIVSGSEDNCLYIWEVLSGRMVQRIRAHTAPVQFVSCHPTWNMIASASLEDGKTVEIWTQYHLLRICS